MHFNAIASLAILTGLAQAKGTIFLQAGTQQAICGMDGASCAQPTCYARIKNVHGCSGQTDTWGGDCLGGPPTLTKEICGSAEIIMNNCHEKICIDFRNENGQTARFICPDGEGSCGDAEDGTCEQKGLGKC